MGEGGKTEPVQEEDSSPEVRKEAALQVVAGRNSEGVCVCVVSKGHYGLQEPVVYVLARSQVYTTQRIPANTFF